VLCVDDNAAVLAALRQKLTLAKGFTWCGSRPDATDLRSAIEFHRPTVVILDIDMPGRDPFVSVKELADHPSRSRVVLFSAHVKRDLIERAMEAGVWGYVSKGDGEDALVDAIRRVAAGEFVLSAEVQSAYLGR